MGGATSAPCEHPGAGPSRQSRTPARVALPCASRPRPAGALPQHPRPSPFGALPSQHPTHPLPTLYPPCSDPLCPPCTLPTPAPAGKPRGYAFVEFEHKQDMKNAYKVADGRKIEDRRVLVDVERGRTVPGWCARLLVLSLYLFFWVERNAR